MSKKAPKTRKKKDPKWPEEQPGVPVVAMGAVGRTTTFPTNGDQPKSADVLPEKVTIGEAMRRAVAELGDVQIDDDLAPAQLRQLGEIIEDVTRRQAAYNLKSDEAKTAKKALESATELLITTVKEFTHPVPLPLFDAKQSTDDHAAMLDADEKARQEVTGESASV